MIWRSSVHKLNEIRSRYSSKGKWAFYLALANALSMASTFFCFAVFAHQGNVKVLGTLVFINTVGGLLHQFSDFGYSALAVRFVGEGHNLPNVFGWLLKKRLTKFVLLSVFLVGATWLTGMEIWKLAIVELIAICSSLYSAGCLIAQSQKRWPLLIAQLLLNTFSFVCVGFCFFIGGWSQAVQMAIALTLAWLLPALFGLVLILRNVSFSSRWHADASDIRSFPTVLAANLFTTNAVNLTVGISSPSFVGIYAMAQQPSLLFAPFSMALSSFLLPSFARRSASDIIRTAHRLARATLTAPFLAILLVTTLTPAFNYLYGASTTPLGAIYVLMAGSSLGLTASVLTTAFVATGNGQVAAKLAILQAVLSLCTVGIAFATNNVLLSAGCDFLVRVAGIIFLWLQIGKTNFDASRGAKNAD